MDQQGREFQDFTTAFNISAGGALVATHRAVPRSCRLELEIPSAPLPPLSVPPEFVRSFQAKVVRITNWEGYHLCGLRFKRPLLPNRPQQ